MSSKGVRLGTGRSTSINDNGEVNEYICMNGADERIGTVMCAMRTAPLEMNALDFLCHIPPVPGLTLGKHLSTLSTYELTH